MIKHLLLGEGGRVYSRGRIALVTWG